MAFRKLSLTFVQCFLRSKHLQALNLLGADRDESER
jgi:hypothetical protein